MAQPYLSLEAELHDAFWEAEDEGSEVALMADFLKRRPGAALEMGAGSGRLLFPLLAMGFEVEGLELSEDMLALAGKRRAQLGVAAVFHHGDMTEWSNGRKYFSILAPAFVLQLAANSQETLRHWTSLLEPGGGIYLSVFIPFAELTGDLPENQWYEDHLVTLPDGREGVLETRHQIDRATRRLHREHRYSLSGGRGKTHESRQTLGWFEHRDMLAMFAKCGLAMERFFVDVDPAGPARRPTPANSDGIVTYHARLVAESR
jgi:SAM-dependent methyltransferase